MAFCKYCGQENSENMKFCKNCGAKLETVRAEEPPVQPPASGSACPYCGSPIQPGAKFCKGCGAGLEASPVTERPRQQAEPLNRQPEPPKPAGRTCPYCGKPIPSNAKFCRFCSKRLDTAEPPSPSAPPDKAPSRGKPVAPAGAFRHPKPDPQDKGGKKFKITPIKAIALGLAVCLILLILPFPRKNGGSPGYPDMNDMDESFAYEEEPGVILGDPGKGGSGTIGVEGETVKIGDVSVNAGIYALDEEETITVEGLPTQTCENGDWKLQSYDVQIGDKHELDDFITVRIPYDPSMIAPGEKEEDCVSALWFNEETESWETMDAEVDTQTKEVVISTDHLSIFGSSTICDAGKRQAYFRTVGMTLSSMYENPIVLDRHKSAMVLQSFVENGGKPAPNLVLEAAGSVISTALNISSETSFYADLISNPINIAGLGSPSFDPGLSKKLNDALGNVGMAASAINIASGFIQGDDASVLGAYKDTANLLIGAASEAGHLASNVGLAMSGVWVLDFTINHMNTFGHLWHMDKHEAAYGVYIDERTPKEWREIMINLVQQYPSDSQALNTAINKKIEDYADDYWDRTHEFEMIDTGHDGWIADSNVMAKDRAELKKKMVQHLYEKLQPVAVSVKEYYQKQMLKEMRRSVAEVFDLYNKNVRLKIYEVLDEGESPEYAGCKVQFGPLNEDGRKHIKNWTGTLNGDGETSTDCSILGYLLAGSPNEVRIYRRGDNPQTDEPIRVVPFVFTERVTEIPITHGQEEQEDEEDPDAQDDRDDSSEQATEPDEKKHGYWKLTNVIIGTPKTDDSESSKTTLAVSGNTVHYKIECTTDTNYTMSPYGPHTVSGHSCLGEFIQGDVSITPPADSYKSGQPLSFDLKATVSQSTHCCPYYGFDAHLSTYHCSADEKMSQEDVTKHIGGVYGSETKLVDKDNEGYAEVYYIDSDNRYTQKYEAKSIKAEGKMPNGGIPGDITYIFFSYTGGLTAYEYTWVE